MNNQKMFDVVTMIANIILPDECDHGSALEIWLRAMKRKAREALESHESEVVGNAAEHAMTLDEAIAHAEEVANSCDTSCGKEHRQLAGWLKELRDVKRMPIGNAAAMREGLIWMKERIIAAIHDGSLDCSEVLNKIEDALSAPARNCDLYASATEALKAQDVAFNEDNFKNGECKLGCPGCDDGLIDCKILWLFAPAEKRKGESDGR